MWLITGLGNPGPKYELTRHNIGFLAADLCLGSAQCKKGFGGEAARVDLAGEPCIILKPLTFMNKSGSSVQQALTFHKLDLDHLIVIHDDLDLALGELRIKKGGSDNGHNGLKDISRLLGPGYIRIRLGIGRPNFKGSEADYVLKPFNSNEFALLEQVLPQAKEAIETVITLGLEQAQAQKQIKSKKKPDGIVN